MPSVAPAVRSAAYDLRGKLLELAGDVFEVSPDDLQHRRRLVRLARRRAARADRRGHGQARQGAAGRHGLARPEPRRHAREHVRLPDRAGRGRRRDGRDHRRAHRRGARHRPRDRAACRRAARSRAACCRASASRSWRSASIDPTTGTVVNANLEDYKLPTHADCPEIVVEFIDRPDPHASTLGLKGLGEPPIVPTAPAIANAVYHATGVRVRTLADHAPPLPGGARRMSAYVRPGTLDEALALLDAPDARCRSPAAPTSCRCRRAARPPGTLVDVRALLGDAIEAQRRRARDRRCDPRGRRRGRRARGRALRRAGAGRGAGRLAAAAQSGHGRRATWPSTCAAGTSATPT